MMLPGRAPGVVSPSPGVAAFPYPTPAVKLLELDRTLNVDLIPGRPGNRYAVAQDLRAASIGNDDFVKLRRIRTNLRSPGKVGSAVI